MSFNGPNQSDLQPPPPARGQESHWSSALALQSPVSKAECLCLSGDLVDLDPLIPQLDLRPGSSLQTSLLITGLCLTIINLPRPDPDLWIPFLAWGRPCFITTELSDALGSRLKLAATPRPALPASFEGSGVGPAWWGSDLAATLSLSVPLSLGADSACCTLTWP